MCGILGYFDFNKNLPSKNEFKKTLNLMKHRGPDGFGIDSFDYGFLGHRRLSIIDLSNKAKQPMTNEDNTVWITYNGEIYNYKELRKELEKKHFFKSKSDTEILVHGYEEWGIDKLLKKINGQFAFGLYDLNKKTVYLARDRVGINPLYYSFNKNKLIFASELKSIIPFLKNKTLNKDALNIYFKVGYIIAPSTIYNEALKLKPGHYLIFKNTGTSIKKYWDVGFGDYILNENKIITKLREEIDRSVKERLIADVPVGAFLSGGVDSSAIVATAKKYKENLHTFSIGFENKDYDETEYAESVAKYLNTEHHTKDLTESDFFRLLDKIPSVYDEPFADSSQIPTMFVSEFAKRYVTVSLSGDGGDELFGGYERYKEIYKYAILNQFIRCTTPIWEKMVKYNYNHNFSTKISYFSDYAYYYYHLSKEFNIKEKNLLNNSQLMDLKSYLPDDILTKVDRSSLAVSLESRPPLLDHKLIELSCRIPFEYRFKNNSLKYIFKKTVEDRIPKKNIYRSKKGFAVNLIDYIKNNNTDYKYFKGYLSESYFNKIISNSNNPNYWAIISFYNWCKYNEK